MAGVDALIRQITALQIHDGDGNAVAGIDAIRKPNGVVWATNLWVKPEYRGQWYSVGLIRRLVREYGDEDIYCEACPYADRELDTDRLIKLYSYFGFSETGVPGVLVRKSRKT